jgi:hypothetical protein
MKEFKPTKSDRKIKKAIIGGTLEFRGHLVALHLLAQWVERLCGSVVAHLYFLACFVQSYLS